jgi:hypothetical protein
VAAAASSLRDFAPLPLPPAANDNCQPKPPAGTRGREVCRFDSAASRRTPDVCWYHCASDGLRFPVPKGIFADFPYSDMETNAVGCPYGFPRP